MGKDPSSRPGRAPFRLNITAVPPIRSKARYCIKEIQEALARNDAALIDRAARAIENAPWNVEDTCWHIIDAIEGYAAKIGPPPHFTTAEATANAKALIRNHAPEVVLNPQLAVRLRNASFDDAFAAAGMRRGRPRADARKGSKWEAYPALLLELGFGRHKPDSIEKGLRRFRRRKHSRKPQNIG
jgi:hypothetical protein